jgi:predicted ATP-dependent endonuclease of OLD family
MKKTKKWSIPMKIESLYLNNVGNFEDFRINFNESRNALFGINGIGKSTLLNSIASCLYTHDSRKKEPLFFRKDFKYPNVNIRVDISYHKKDIDSDTPSLFEKKDFEEDNIISVVLSNKDEDLKEKLNELNKDSDGKLVYFTSNRFFSENPATPKPKIEKEESILNIYDQDAKTFTSPNKVHEYIIHKEINEGLGLLYHDDEKSNLILKDIINSVLNGKEFIKIRENKHSIYEVIFIDIDTKKEFTLFDLSHGEKLMLMFIVEFHKNRWNNSIIMIDEPELSLHPDWQMKLIPKLQELGENNQFIVATHSEEIVYIFDEDEVFYLG